MTATRPDDVPSMTTREKTDPTMTASPLDTPPARPAASTDPPRATAPPAYRITMARVVRAEWIKLRTLRSTWAVLAAVLLTVVGLGAIAAASATGAVEGPGDGGPGAGDPLSTVLSGSMLAVVLVGVLGVLIGAREYSSGLIRSSLAAVPARLPVLWAKVAAFLVAVVPVVLAGVFAAYAVGMTVLDAGGVTTVAWSDEGTARVVLGTAAFLVGMGLIGLALGMLLRSTAGAISALLAGVLVLPTLAGSLLPEAWDGLLKYLPSNASSAFTTTVPAESLLSPGAGALVFVAWIVVALGGAAVALTRRDA
jgi:ABC-2 type transport system permease protein